MKSVCELKQLSNQARLLALDAVYTAKSGHLGGSFSIIDTLTVLYWNVMRVNPEDSRNPDRDRFILSKGHCSPACYSVLALRGYFDPAELKHFRNINYHMSGHVEMHGVNGVDMSAGSLGQGLSAGIGMALGARLNHKDYHTYVVMGDGEIAEGQIWEAAMAAGHYHLDNLTGIVDVNGLQIDGPTAQVMDSSPLKDKFAAFGWHVVEVDGHDYAALEQAFSSSNVVPGKPTMVLCRTVKGKGVSFMENQVGWHGKAPSAEEFEQAKTELMALLAEEVR